MEVPFAPLMTGDPVKDLELLKAYVDTLASFLADLVEALIADGVTLP